MCLKKLYNNKNIGYQYIDIEALHVTSQPMRKVNSRHIGRHYNNGQLGVTRQ